MELTLAQALKFKNRLAQRIAEVTQQIQQSNVYVEGNTPDFKMSDLLDEHNKVIDAMVALKVAIQTANVPILGKIYRLAEYKNMAGIYRSMDTRSGRQVSRWPDDGSVTVNIAQISKQEAVDRQRRFEKNIDDLQAEIDTFNAMTKITIADSCNVL